MATNNPPEQSHKEHRMSKRGAGRGEALAPRRSNVLPAGRGLGTHGTHGTHAPAPKGSRRPGPGTDAGLLVQEHPCFLRAEVWRHDLPHLSSLPFPS